MSFWTASTLEPKRKHRFRVTIPLLRGDSSDPYIWYAKSIDKPIMTFAVVNENELNVNDLFSDNKILTNPSFNQISMTLIDPGTPDATTKLVDILTAANYGKDYFNYSESLASTLGEILIEQLDATGSPIETWTLVQPNPVSVDFGSLDYSSDDLLELKVTWVYSTIRYANASGDILSPDPTGALSVICTN